MSLGEPNGNNFAPDIPHCEPDDVPCELRSCPRPATHVLLLRGQYRIRCDVHAAELRRQGATLTELDPGFDHPPGQPPANVPNIPEVPVCKIADCTSPAKTRGFCMLHWGRGLRVLRITSGAHVSDEVMQAAILRWTPAPHGPTPKSPEVTNADTPSPAAPAPSPEPSGGIFDTMLRSTLDLAIDVDNTEVIDCVTRLVDANRKLRREMDDSFSAGWRKASDETAALGVENVELQRELARARSDLQTMTAQYQDSDDLVGRICKVLDCEGSADTLVEQVESLKNKRDLARERLALARNALLLDEYFKPQDVGYDIAPRIIERLAAAATKSATLTEEDLERRFAALVESRKLRAIALGEVSDVA